MITMSLLLDGLNEQQQLAVQTTEGPVLVLAGAGSGKTKMLVHRIAYLIQEKQIRPEEILAVTFTNKAANEMRERIGKLLGQSVHRGFMPYMGTFHGICVRILRQDGDLVGVNTSFVIFDSADSKAVIKRAMKDLKIDAKQHDPRKIANIISSAKNELITPSDYEGVANGPVQEIAAKVYKRYQHLLQEAKAVDFDDLLMKTAQLFRHNQEALAKWQAQFRYIMIDEYQDTNTVQYMFAKLLASKHHNICVVGDDWQSIYSWRGADFQNILNFNRDYPEVLTIKLEQNYRSTKSILDAAHQVITKNTTRSDKELWTAAGAGEPVRIVQALNERQEGEMIVDFVNNHVKLGARKHGEFAILYRTNAQSRTLEETFLRYNLPYRIVGGTRFYDRKEIKDIIAYLRLVYQPDDRTSFDRVVNTPTRGVGAKSMQVFHDWVGIGSQWDKMQQVTLCPGLTGKAATSLHRFSEMIARLRDYYHEGAQLAELVDAVIKRTDYLNYLEDGSLQAEERQENVKELLSVAKEQSQMGLGEFLEEVALISDLDSYDTGSDAVTLMTLHAAKGLEFPVVFMVGMEEGIFPHSSTFYDQEELEEERRLCYVGMTRAEQELHLTYASSRLLYGATQYNPPSRFLSDIDAKLASAGIDTSARGIDTEPVEDEAVMVDIGDRVQHPVFGFGVIKSINGTAAQIAFDRRGIKTLNLAFAPLEKQ